MNRRKIKIIVICLIFFGVLLGLRKKYIQQNVFVNLEHENVIVIDAGHGGSDPGMTGIDNLQEKEINLKIASKVYTILTSMGYKTIMTRTEDKGLYDETSRNKKAQDLQNRIEIMKDTDAVLAVSIHQNSYPDSSIKGPQVFYYETSASGKLLAECIQNSLNENLKIERPRKIKGNDTYYLLKRSPCVLTIVECGFLTNPKEAELLQTEEYQEKVANAIVLGICSYIESVLTSDKVN